jgi:hypothetical protein
MSFFGPRKRPAAIRWRLFVWRGFEEDSFEAESDGHGKLLFAAEAPACYSFLKGLTGYHSEYQVE